MYGGAWPLLVGGVICLVDSVNERDLDDLMTGISTCSSMLLRLRTDVG